MGIITLSQYKSLQGITDTTNDTLISALITPVQAAIESYCDRKFDSVSYYQWFEFNKYIVLPQYPVIQVLALGNSEVFATVSIVGDYTVEIASDRVYVVDGKTFTSTSFLFSAYATITLLCAAITAAFAGIVFTITATYSAYTPYRLRTGVIYDTLYGAAPSKIGYRIPDNSDRIIEVGYDSSLGFFYAFDEFYFDVIYIAWTAGYTSSTMPSDLQLVMSNIIRDMVDASVSNVSGLFKSETLTNYQYVLANPEDVRRFIAKYYDQLETWKLKKI